VVVCGCEWLQVVENCWDQFGMVLSGCEWLHVVASDACKWS
jgi:hypothetical protein